MRRIHIPSQARFVATLWMLSMLTVGCRSIYRVDPVIDTSRDRPNIWSKRHIPFRGGITEYFLDLHPIHLNPYTYNPGGGVPLYKIATTHTNEATRAAAKLARNELQNAILGASFESTAQHLAGIKSAENGGNLLLGGATLGLTGGASVAAPTTARALSAAATGSGGGRALFNEQTFRNALVESLTQAVETDRAEFLETIIRPKQTNEVDQYDVEAAIFDARVYHEKGSFYHGLALIREAVEKENQNRKTNTTMRAKENMGTK